MHSWGISPRIGREAYEKATLNARPTECSSTGIMSATYYPTVDLDTCIGDKECYEVCPKSVFDWNEDDAKPLVARPDDCIDGCVECAKACPVEAITFPN